MVDIQFLVARSRGRIGRARGRGRGIGGCGWDGCGGTGGRHWGGGRRLSERLRARTCRSTGSGRGLQLGGLAALVVRLRDELEQRLALVEPVEEARELGLELEPPLREALGRELVAGAAHALRARARRGVRADAAAARAAFRLLLVLRLEERLERAVRTREEAAGARAHWRRDRRAHVPRGRRVLHRWRCK